MAFEPAPLYEIDELETIKLVSDPLRLNMLHLVTPEARTVKQVAEILHLQPHKLYYHMNMLEEHGLVKLVDQQIVGGVVEKYYRAVALHFIMSPDLLKVPDGEGGALGEFADFIFSDTRAEFKNSVAKGWIQATKEAQYGLVLSRRMAMLTKKEAAEFTRRLSNLLQDFSARSQYQEGDGREPYLLLTTFFRTAEMEADEDVESVE